MINFKNYKDWNWEWEWSFDGTVEKIFGCVDWKWRKIFKKSKKARKTKNGTTGHRAN